MSAHPQQPPPVLDIVVPVHNEQDVVEACVRRLHAHLTHTFPYPFRITIADNASVDQTWIVAQRLARQLPEVTVRRLAAKGRGRALKAAWLASEAPILAYTDVDLSTDLDALWPLIGPLLSGHSDLAIGTRLSRSSRVVRGVKREAISRCYNGILRVGLSARFSDAQCGFKAIRSDVAAELLPLVQDPGWFFDTELLVLAEKCQLRIHEVPVDWLDDPDSRVDIVRTATDDLRGVWRLRRALARGSLPVDDLTRRLGRLRPAAGVGAQAMLFLAIGLVSFVLQLSAFAGLRYAGIGPQLANVMALLGSTVLNTWANRRWTFGVRGRSGAARHQVQGLAILGGTLLLTAGGLAVLHLAGVRSPAAQTAMVGLATVAATAGKFAVMRRLFVAGGRVPGSDSRRGAIRPAETGSGSLSEAEPAAVSVKPGSARAG